MLTCGDRAWAAAPLGTTRQQVRRAKVELETRPTRSEYDASPYRPSQIVEGIHGLESASAWLDLCRELGALPDAELELFEDEVRKPEHARHMPCAQALLARLDAFWLAAAKALDRAHPLTTPAASAPGLGAQIIPLARVGSPLVLDGSRLQPGQVALTFDDGPHPTRTARVLAILAAAGVRATFFQIGRNAAKFPGTTRQLLAAGHTLGSHTWSHPNLSTLAEGHAETEIESGEANVALAAGEVEGQLHFFRFPYGAHSPVEQKFVEKRGNVTLFWNMDSQDWRIRDPHKLFLNVLAELDRAHGGIILFHDIHEQTVIVLPHVLDELRVRNMTTVVFVADPGRDVHETGAAQAGP